MSEPNKKSILVIDDDVTIRKLITHHLKLNNFLPFEAPSSEEAFEILKHNKIDLVLSDVTMEGMDGFTFCQKVRENEKHRFLPFIFVTAKNTLEDKSKAVESGGDDIITKPFDIKELILKIQALIRRSDIYRTYGLKKSLQNAFDEKRTNVLFVDDDPSMAKLFKYNIEQAGYNCELAFSVEEAMIKLQKTTPDLIISDIMMPQVDGLEFRRMLLKDKNLKNIPFIFLTAKGSEQDVLEGYDLGIADYLVKTAGPKVVVAKVQAIIKSLGNERKKVLSELHDAASSLRTQVVPDSTPEFPGFVVEHWHIPFSGVPGGDFIDYFRLDENNLAIVLGDVMGKKWGAWYFAFAYAGYIRSALRGVLQSVREYSPGEILQEVNSSVYKDSKVSEVFATLSIVIINNLTSQLKYAGAGDLPIIYREATTGKVSRIRSKGLLLGFAEDGDYKDESIDLNTGDQIYLITDGIIESRSSNNETYGEQRLLELIESTEDGSEGMKVLQNDFKTFTQESFDDDISIISIRPV